jgi:hypothetical protein
MTRGEKKLLIKIFKRFLKENGIYVFIIGEIKKEYPLGMKGFIDYIIRKNCVRGLFNLHHVLTFRWDDFYFWHDIHHQWGKVCDLILDDATFSYDTIFNKV